MTKNKYEKGVVAQKDQVEQGVKRISELKDLSDKVKIENKSQSDILDDLQESMNNLFKDLGIDISSIDLCNIESDDLITNEEIESINNKFDNMFSPLQKIEFNSYDDYLDKVDKYLKEAGIDTNIDPISQLFTEEELKKALGKYKDTYGKLEWNKLDYIVIGISGVIAILLDYFIVKIPSDMNFLGKDYKGSPLTKSIQEKTTSIYKGEGEGKLSSWLNNGMKHLESYAKVPYDKSINTSEINVYGLSPSYHRLMSFGHDPIMGFIFGLIDILRGTMTIVDKNGVLKVVDVGQGSFNIFSAFIKVFAHLLSDICTPMGIAPPFMPLLQLITGKTPFILNKNGEKITAN